MASTTAVRIALFLAFLPVMAQAGPARASGPARLRLEVESSSLGPGESTRVTVLLLDSRFQRVPNDRIRQIQLEIRTTGSPREGRGSVSPAAMTIPAGRDGSSDIRFTGRSAGMVVIRATSNALAPAEALVHVRAGSKSWLDLVAPTVYAQNARQLEILPPYEPIPLNGLSTAQFQLFAADTGPARLFRVDTTPAVCIRYGEEESVGVALVRIDDEEHLSGTFEILPPDRPRPIVIRAQALPDGARTETRVEFVAPFPARVEIEPAEHTINPHERIVPVTVRLLDADSIPLKAISEPRKITLETDTRSGSFEPQTVTLTPTKLQAVSNFFPPVLRFGRPLTVFARLDDIATAQAHFDVKAATTALVLLALFGGLLGGVARHVYRVGTPRFWPRRSKGRLDPGLAGNALASALSGLVLFQAIDLGMLHTIEGFESIHGNGTLAFVLGVIGGFSGIAVFEVMSERVLNRTREELDGREPGTRTV